MKVEVIISCMNFSDKSLINKINLESDVLIINQCDYNGYEEFVFEDSLGNNRLARIISTTEKGLSRSRNMGIKNSQGDICIICDDDEIFYPDYNFNILKAFADNQNSDIIAFKIDYSDKTYADKAYRVNFFKALSISSCQITFRRDSILNAGVLFDVKMGSGSGNGGGEENKFLIDSLNKGLKINYHPILIAKIIESDSLWFKGFDSKYFIDKGWAIRRILGPCWSYLYIICFCLMKYNIYKNDLSLVRAFFCMNKGFFDFSR